MRQQTATFDLPEDPTFGDLRQFIITELERYMESCKRDTNPSVHGFALDLLYSGKLFYDKEQYDS